MLSRVSIIFFAFSLCLPTASASSSNENVTNQQEAHTISILDMFRYFNKQAIRTIVRARYGLENAILGEDFDIDMSYNACARPSSSGDRKRSPLSDDESVDGPSDGTLSPSTTPPLRPQKTSPEAPDDQFAQYDDARSRSVESTYAQGTLPPRQQTEAFIGENRTS